MQFLTFAFERQPFSLTLLSLAVFISTWSVPVTAEDTLPDVKDLPIQEGLPDPLKMLDGTPVTTAEAWYGKRRPELKRLFAHYMYGFAPPAPENVHGEVVRVDKNFLGGKATKQEVIITFGISNSTPLASIWSLKH